jgi:hypothetical protein
VETYSEGVVAAAVWAVDAPVSGGRHRDAVQMARLGTDHAAHVLQCLDARVRAPVVFMPHATADLAVLQRESAVRAVLRVMK